MNQFRGRFQCKIDPKGRFALPAAYRQNSAEDANFVITNSLYKSQPCLDIYSLDSWESLESKISSMQTLKSQVQAYQRFYLASGQVLQMDSQNRIVVPSSFRKYARLEEELTLIGMGNKFELWSTSIWNHLYEDMTNNFEDILNSVADLASGA